LFLGIINFPLIE